MLQLHPMSSTKKPRILLRIGNNRLATVINVPTDESNLDSKASSPSTIVSSGDMAAISADLTPGKAAHQPSSSRLPSSKMANQRQYRSKKNLRTRNHHSASPPVDDDTKDSQVATPPETATNSGTELKQMAKHEETAATSKKRTRREPVLSIQPDVEEQATKKSRTQSQKDVPEDAGPVKIPVIVTEDKNENKRCLRSQDPRKPSELAALFQEEASPAYVGRTESIRIVEDAPDAVLRLVKKPAEAETPESVTSSTISSIPQPPATPITPIPVARSAPITTFDFSQFEKKAARFVNDPLKDSLYEIPHKKHTMKEKRWRNIENEKSQQLYNKLRNELEKLKGPEWFKVLGFNRPNPDAITKKEHLITSIEMELSKQRRFTEELRKQKRAKAERTTSPEHLKPGHDQHRSRSTTREHGGDDHDGERPSKSRKTVPYPEVKPVEKPFTSFFSKDHLRNAATKNWRKSGRHAQAFGQSLPSIPQIDFDHRFPKDYVEEVTKLKAL